jgi:hypothetical protein
MAQHISLLNTIKYNGPSEQHIKELEKLKAPVPYQKENLIDIEKGTQSKERGMQGIIKVGLSILKRKPLSAISGSLLFEEITDTGFKLNPNDRVFFTHRVVNGVRHIFEVHFDTKTNKFIDIFWVI